MFITDEQVEKALNFLRDSAQEYGRLRGEAKYLEHKRKIVRSQAILVSEAKTIALKEAEAECSPEYLDVCEEIRQCETDFGILVTLMKAAELKTEVWRSLNARAGRGHL